MEKKIYPNLISLVKFDNDRLIVATGVLTTNGTTESRDLKLDGLGTTNFRLDSGRLTDSLRGLRGKDKETRKGFTIVLRSLFSEVSLDEPGKFVKVSRLSCKR